MPKCRLSKMKPEIKARWIEALRSGNYDQAKGTLRDPDNPQAFCCLGVLCDIVKPEVGGDWRQDAFTGKWHFSTEPAYEGEVMEHGMPPWRVIQYAFENGETIRERSRGSKLEVFATYREDTLPEMNDDGFKFEYIADEIEVTF